MKFFHYKEPSVQCKGSMDVKGYSLLEYTVFLVLESYLWGNVPKNNNN